MTADRQAKWDVADPADQLVIEDIIRRERAARDGENWDELAACYTADSLVDISWFTGTGAAFAAASAGMATRMFSFHELGASIVDIRGDRALGNTSCTIHLIGKLDDTEVDVLGYVRSRARVQRVAGKWRMAGLRAVYIHDLIVPLNPAPAADRSRGADEISAVLPGALPHAGAPGPAGAR